MADREVDAGLAGSFLAELPGEVGSMLVVWGLLRNFLLSPEGR